jgi:hypothetical protein
MSGNKKTVRTTAIILFILLIFGFGVNSGLQSVYSQPSSTTGGNDQNNLPLSDNSTTTFASAEKKLPAPSELPSSASPQPVPLSEQRKILQQQLLKEVDTGPGLPHSNKTIQGPTNNTQTHITSTNSTSNPRITNETASLTRTAIPARSSTASIRLLTNATVVNPNVNSVLEPSVANNGSTVFYTGNWFASRSSDGGESWKHRNVFKDVRDQCCDNDIIYDPNHKIFIWYLQGIEKDPEIIANNPDIGLVQSDLQIGENHIVIGTSHDAQHWRLFTFKPRDINGTWTNQMSDYPYLALSNKYLYTSMNMFGPGGHFVRSILLRVSLDDLARGVAPSFSYYNDPRDTAGNLFTFTPVQGATNTMYWAVHLSNDAMRIYQWNEASNIVKTFDRSVPPWAFLLRGDGDCPGPDKINWCARAMSKITGGWIQNDTVGFLWNADKGGISAHGATFPYPYINAATFKVNSDMKYQGRPYIWSPNFAWLYGFASPNNRGDVAVSAVFGGGKYYPSMAAGIYNNQNVSGHPWNMIKLVNGTNGPSATQSPFEWGDYLRVRPFSGVGPTWIASGWTLQGGVQDLNVEPRYFIFGKASDVPITENISQKK